jgi:hypothetical protein
MLAIVLPSTRADRLEHVTFLPGKMAAWLVVAGMVKLTAGSARLSVLFRSPWIFTISKGLPLVLQ